MQASMLRFYSTTKPSEVGNARVGSCRDGHGGENRALEDNNENDKGAINNAVSTTAHPAVVALKDLPGKPRQSGEICLSPTSEATGAVISNGSTLTDGPTCLQPPSVTAASGEGKIYGLRNRHSLRSVQEAEFEYSELLLQELDEQDENPVVAFESEYERERRARIAANLEKLQALGLQNGPSEVAGKKVTKASKRKRVAPASHGAQLRRSSRTLGPRQMNTTEDTGCSELQGTHVPSPSSSPTAASAEVPRYDLQPAAWAATASATLDPDERSAQKTPWQAVFRGDEEVEGFHSLHCTLDGLQLRAMYSLDWRGNMVAAAGKEGWCSLFRVPDAPSDSVTESLITSRLHRSWIADVQLLPAATSSSDMAVSSDLPWMISACNDGALSLWDPSQVDNSGRFAELATTSEAHTKGIFSMHICPSGLGGYRTGAIKALTSSKDETVALASICTTGMQIIQRWEDLHHGTIKCVRWRDSSLAATAGNDRVCKLLDVRSGRAVAQIGGGHATAVNSVAWASAAASTSEADEPCGQTHASEHQMLSTSFDAALYVHDIRQPDTPLLGLTGHTVLPKAKSMHQAAFTWGGRGVVCGGDGGEMLSLYDIRSCAARHDARIAANVGQQAVMISQAKLGHRITTTQARGHCLAVAGPSSLVSILQCNFK